MAYRGRYYPKNIQKYIGNPNNIIYRSLWERKMMVQFDRNPKILEWSSEEIKIRYYYPLDNSFHWYFPDFLIKYKKRDGSIKVTLIEIKPKKFTKPPTPTKTGKMSKRYIQESYIFAKNHCKFEAAKKFAKENGFDFLVITEDDVLF